MPILPRRLVSFSTLRSALARASCAAFLLAMASSALRADTITMSDGKVISEVTIVSESVKEISYREKGKPTEVKVSSDNVLRVAFQPLPKALDAAEGMAQEGDVEGAIDQMKALAESVLDGSNKTIKQSWAPAYALYRCVELSASIGDYKRVVSFSDNLIGKAGDSRRAPLALLAKAQAQRYLDDQAAAKTTAEALRAYAQEHGLSRRWTLEADLIAAMSDTTLSEAKRRDALKAIAAAAGKEFPTVASRAMVYEGESWIGGQEKDFAKAIEIFKTAADDSGADDETRAGAFAGLGDCLFQEAQGASGADRQALLEDAAIAYLRVFVLYPERSGYAAKAGFFAGRVFETMEAETSKTRARRMYAQVADRYPGSNWASQAKAARR